MNNILFLLIILIGSIRFFSCQHIFLTNSSAVLSNQSYLGNALYFTRWGESYYIRNEFIGNANIARTRLRLHLTDDWTYNQGFEILAHRWDGVQRSLFYISSDRSLANFFSGANFNSNIGIYITSPVEKHQVFRAVVFCSKDFRLLKIGRDDGTYLNIKNPLSDLVISLAASSRYVQVGYNTDFQLTNNSGIWKHDGNVGIETSNTPEKLCVNGNIKTKKIIVTQQGWPDYFSRIPISP